MQLTLADMNTIRNRMKLLVQRPPLSPLAPPKDKSRGWKALIVKLLDTRLKLTALKVPRTTFVLQSVTTSFTGCSRVTRLATFSRSMTLGL